MTLHELKQIHLSRQHITSPCDKITVLRDLCGVQAQFMSNALHSLRIRCTEHNETTLSCGLVKNWTVRGTVHVFAEEDLPLFIHCNDGQDYRKNEWNGYRFWNKRDVWALTPERQKYLSEVILDSLKARPHTRDELKDICRDAGMTPNEEGSMFDQWGGGIRELCERGFMNYTVKEKKEFCLSPGFTPIPKSEAQLEIVKRYLTHMAPATIDDIRYYFKCTKKQAKEWISQLSAKSFTIDGREYFHLGRLDGDYPDIPRCVFLAGFDQLMLAYEKKQSIYLPDEYMRGIFNLAGIVMPALLFDGVVIGRWRMTSGKLEVFPFRDLSEVDKKIIRDSAEALWINELRSVKISR